MADDPTCAHNRPQYPSFQHCDVANVLVRFCPRPTAASCQLPAASASGSDGPAARPFQIATTTNSRLYCNHRNPVVRIYPGLADNFLLKAVYNHLSWGNLSLLPLAMAAPMISISRTWSHSNEATTGPMEVLGTEVLQPNTTARRFPGISEKTPHLASFLALNPTMNSCQKQFRFHHSQRISVRRLSKTSKAVIVWIAPRRAQQPIAAASLT